MTLALGGQVTLRVFAQRAKPAGEHAGQDSAKWRATTTRWISFVPS